MIKVPYTFLTLILGTIVGILIGIAIVNYKHIPAHHTHPWIIVIILPVIFLAMISFILIDKEN